MIVVRPRGPGTLVGLEPVDDLDEVVVLERFLQAPRRLGRNPLAGLGHPEQFFLALRVALEILGDDPRQPCVPVGITESPPPERSSWPPSSESSCTGAESPARDFPMVFSSASSMLGSISSMMSSKARLPVRMYS